MQVLGVLVDGGSCLGAAIAFHVVELKGINAEFAGDAFERNPIVDLFRCVIAHIFNCSPSGRTRLGREMLVFWLEARKPTTRERPLADSRNFFAANG
jgi:hypothetical protein